MIEKIKNLLLYGGVPKNDYLKIHDDITESNRKNLIMFSLVVTVGMVVMLFASLFDDSLVKNRTAYLASAVICIILYILALKPAKNRSLLTYICVYVFIGLLFAFGIDLGTFVEPNEVSVSFEVILFAAPLLFTDRPMNMSLMIVLGIIGYLICAAITQDPVMQGYNRSNVLPYGVIAMIVSSYMMQIKVGRYMLEYKNKFLIESDQMTGMLNRRSYEQHIENLRLNGCPSGAKICAFDVNGLKSVNDNIGHHAGDELIRGAAGCIEKVFGPYGKCYRTGGDEFVSIIEGNSPEREELEKGLLQICNEFRGECLNGLSISVGIVESEDGSSVDQLVIEADRQMYKAKAEYYSKAGIDRRKL